MITPLRLLTKLSQEYKIPLNKNLPVMTSVFDTNQKIKMTDLGKSDSLNIIITKPTIKLVIVIAKKELVNTLIPVY